MDAWNGGFERWHGTLAWNGGIERMHGTDAWNGGMERWHENGGMEQWHGTVAVRGLYVLLDNEADRIILHSFLRVSPSRNSESKRVLSAIE